MEERKSEKSKKGKKMKNAKPSEVKSLDSNSMRMCPALLKQIRENFELTPERTRALKLRNEADGTLSMTELVGISAHASE